MVARRFYCVSCMRWYGPCSRSEHQSLCYHCWRYACEWGWSALFDKSDRVRSDFTWRGVLAPVVVAQPG